MISDTGPGGHFSFLEGINLMTDNLPNFFFAGMHVYFRIKASLLKSKPLNNVSPFNILFSCFKLTEKSHFTSEKFWQYLKISPVDNGRLSKIRVINFMCISVRLVGNIILLRLWPAGVPTRIK